MKTQRVFIIDDSAVFRTQISASLKGIAGIEVVGSAENGKRGLEKMVDLDVDLVIVDLEMPVMDGNQFLDELMKSGSKTKAIMFSAATINSALSTLKALNRGALDFVLKPTMEGDPGRSPSEKIREALLPKLQAFLVTTTHPQKVVTPVTTGQWRDFKPEAIVIGSSTGGPNALEKIFEGLGPNISVPIFICQHMPPIFTKALAERLKSISGLDVCEAAHGDLVVGGRIYIAPGNYHMRLKKAGTTLRIALDQEPPRHFVRPSVDHLFESAVQFYGKNLLAVVLTGMGDDGKDGAVAIKAANGFVMIQDQASSVVWGMPRAVHDCGAFDKIEALPQIQGILRKMAA